MKIGLLGFGTVGKGVYDIVAQRPDMAVSQVLCRRELTLDDAKVTHSMQTILEDESIDTVVEVMGGLHPAYEYVRDAMASGKHVITANKALVATHYEELLALAEKHGVCLRATAAVGGGIGWLSELERARRVQRITALHGIVNGTCNYILDAMTRLNLDYPQVLTQAQALGYAEADPTTDVEGTDSWHKLLLSANIAFGIHLQPESVPVCGISQISGEDIANFTAHGRVCKLMACAEEDEATYHAYVHPVLVPVGEPEAAVPENYNHITLVGSLTGKQSLFGQGAGRYPTAYNVVQDCVDVLAGHGFYAPLGRQAQADNSKVCQFYVRGCRDAWLDANTQTHWGNAIITRPVSIREMHSWKQAHPQAFLAQL